MPMLAAITCLARRRRMHCRGSDVAAAAVELEQRQYGPGDQRHHWRAEPALSGLIGHEETCRLLPRAPLPHGSSRQGRRRLPQDGGPALDCRSRRRRQAVAVGSAEQALTQVEARGQQQGPGSGAVALDEAPAAGGHARAEAETASAPSSGATSSVLCAVCLEEVRRGRGEAASAAAEATTLPCSHSYHPGCVLPWLAAHRACPCCRATVPSPED